MDKHQNEPRSLTLGKSELTGQTFQIPAARSGTKKWGIVGISGSGKTHNAAVLAEQYIHNSIPIVVFDPVGRWWDLGIAADGHSKGLPIAIIGGQHGQIDLTPDMGSAIARYVSEHRVPTVIDLSQMRSKSHWRQVVADFGNELFEINRTPVQIIIEEAPEFVPQRVMESVAGVYGAMDKLIRIGRNKGIGITLIAQRPQMINKDSLSQVNALLVMRLSDPGSIDAAQVWLEAQGADSDLIDTFIAQLPTLADGTGLVLSPAWLKTFDRVHFNLRETFHYDPESDEDETLTPDIAQAVDTAQLEKMFSKFMEKGRGAPSRPRAGGDAADTKRVAELEQRLRSAESRADELQTALEAAQESIITEDEVTQRIHLAVQDREARIVRLETMVNGFIEQAKQILDTNTLASPAILASGIAAPQAVAAYVAKQSEYFKNSTTTKILETMRDNYLRFPNGMTREEIALEAHYDPLGGRFNTTLRLLKKRKVIVQDGDRYLLNPAHLK
ncbi:MAG: hypothetical protein MOGMAGMI_02538 [Candidatus Omnitrophica bacterium]|nr:hypothetical protein [Candidatus Omnitrophota bacterium]